MQQNSDSDFVYSLFEMWGKDGFLLDDNECLENEDLELCCNFKVFRRGRTDEELAKQARIRELELLIITNFIPKVKVNINVIG